MPIDQWPVKGSPVNEYPWSIFSKAQGHIAANQVTDAVLCWQQIAKGTELEPRHRLQAWTFLRFYGQEPPPEAAKDLLGVVVEVTMPGGLDLLAAYPDHSARYYNFSGAGVVWEHPDSTLDGLIDQLLAASAAVVAQIGPWEGDRPPPPPAGQIRLSFLTPSGLHFGQGPFDVLQNDPLGGSAVQAATRLMLGLVEKSKSK